MISAIILTKNEEKNISSCIKSLNWTDEIVIIDDYSNDNTLQIIKNLKMKVKIYERNLDNNFAGQKNFGLSKAKGKWVLFIDADEIISDKLAEEILLKIKNTESNGFFIRRRDIFLGHTMKYGETGNVKLLRLGRKNSGKWKRKVHEIWNVNGKTEILNNELIHNHQEGLNKFIEKINKYSTIHARENKREGKESSIFKIIIYPIAKFINNYFFKLGFIDGIKGFVFAYIMSFHSFLAWSKLWMD